MAHVVKNSKIVKNTDYELLYKDLDSGNMYAFSCDKQGSVFVHRLNSESKKSYEKFKNDPRYECLGIEKYEWNYREPSVLKCDCGAEVDLFNFTNTCERCDTDYNMSGQKLCPREYWGEETGEHPSDCY